MLGAEAGVLAGKDLARVGNVPGHNLRGGEGDFRGRETALRLYGGRFGGAHC